MKENYIKILKRFEAIYFFTCDPGAFYAAEPIYEDMKAAGKKCIWIFDGWCARNKKAIIESERANDFKRDTLDINIASSCIIIGGQACSRCNFSMIEHCEKIGLFSIYLFDNWGTYLDNLIDTA